MNVHYASASLYVGDLQPEVEESTLYEVFNAVGPVSSIRVCRDANTHKSLGYAYVNYHTVQDAERALDSLNYTPIKGVPCRIMWSHRDPGLRRSGNGNVFVKNLDKMVDNKALYDTFSLFGTILSCKVATDEHGKSLGYGFVHYESDAAANEAIAKVNGMDIGSKPVYVGKFKKRTERGDTRDEVFTNLYIKHLPDEWTEETIKEVFSPFGEITSMVINQDNRKRRFAFVNYSSKDAAKEAVEKLHGKKTTKTGVMTKEEEEAEAKAQAEAKAEAEAGAEAEAKAGAEAGAEADAKAGAEAEVKAEPETGVEGESEAGAEAGTAPGAAPQAAATSEQETTTGTAADNIADDQPATAAAASSTKSQQEPGTPTSPLAKTLLADVPEDRLYVQRAMTKQERIKKLRDAFAAASSQDSMKQVAVNLYVKNLHEDIDDEALREAFAQFGTVTSARVMKNESGVSRGFGFVCFAFPEDATKAVTAMHLKVFHGKPLYVGLAEKRENRIARLQQRYRGGGGGGRPPTAPQQSAVPPAAIAAMPYGGTTPPAVYYNAAAAARAAATGPALGGGGAATTPTYPAAWRQMPRPPFPAAAAAAGGPPLATTAAPAATTAAYHPFLPPGASTTIRGVPPPPQAAVGRRPPTTAVAATQPPYVGLPLNNKPTETKPTLTAAQLAQAHPQMQKQMLGEQLFPLVAKRQPELAGKITGMMLEMDNNELLSLLENEARLQAKVEEALGVLHRHQQAAA